MKFNKSLFFITVSLVAAVNSYSATYTVDAAGGYDYTSISDCAKSAQAGDTCIVRNGTYSGSITPQNDGSAGSWITFKASSEHSPIVSGSWNLEGRRFIIIDGFTINGSVSTNPYSGTPASNLKILNNKIQNTGVGINVKADDVLISGNTFNNMSNDMIRQFGSRWVIRDNTVIDEADSNNVHMDFWQTYCSGSSTGVVASYSLVENNTMINVSGGNVHFALANATSACGQPVVGMIFRFNKVHNIGSLGIYIDNNQAASGTSRNVIYNNTMSNLHNGSPADWEDYSYILTASTNSRGINNIFYNTLDRTGATGFIAASGWEQSHNLYYDSRGTISFAGAASSEVGAVKNRNPLITDPKANNFALQSGSAAIDAGGPLTTVANGDSGSGTSLVLNMVEFFQPGWGGASADWISVGSVSNIVQISSINYSTKTITINREISRSAGDPVWLYKKSDGVQVLSGKAPDIGAVEFGGQDSPEAPSTLEAPSNLRMVIQ